MKPSLINLLQIACAAMLFLSVQSCNRIYPGTWKNETISESKRQEFHELNTKVLKYLQSADQGGLKSLLSKDTSKKDFANKRQQVVKLLKEDKYHLLDEYYMIHEYADTDTVAATGPLINRHGIKLPYVTTEMYCGFFLSEKSPNKTLLTLTYGKYPSGWKLVDLQTGFYSFNGKTGPQLYSIAYDQFYKKQLQASFFNAALAVKCMKPSTYWLYPQKIDANILFIRARVAAVVHYSYPFLLDKVSTRPMILDVTYKITDNGGYPDVWYMTHFNIKDTTAVKKENMQMRGIIKNIMPGLGDGYQYIYYSAFNAQPTVGSTPPHFDMSEKLH